MKTYFCLSILNKIDCWTRLLHHWRLLPSLQLRPLQSWPWSCAHRRAWLWSANKDVNENQITWKLDTFRQRMDWTAASLGGSLWPAEKDAQSGLSQPGAGRPQ